MLVYMMVIAESPEKNERSIRFGAPKMCSDFHFSCHLSSEYKLPQSQLHCSFACNNKNFHKYLLLSVLANFKMFTFTSIHRTSGQWSLITRNYGISTGFLVNPAKRILWLCNKTHSIRTLYTVSPKTSFIALNKQLRFINNDKSLGQWINWRRSICVWPSFLTIVSNKIGLESRSFQHSEYIFQF